MNGRHILAIILFFTCPARIVAQCNDWDNLISGERIFIRDSQRDPYRNIYITGYFGVQFLNMGNVHLRLDGIEGMAYSYFLIKLDKDLNAVWGKAGGNYAFGENVEIDSKGDVIISGHFYEKATFDCIERSTDGRSDVYVAKISPSGIFYWAINSTGQDDDYQTDLAITPDDNIVVGGSYLGNQLFGTAVTRFGGYDGFVAQFDTNGNTQWVKVMGGPADPSYDYLYGIAVDTHSNVVITGFHGTNEFHIDNFVLLASNPSENSFLVKISPTGQTLWAVNPGGAPDSSYGVATDLNDNIYVTGRFYEGPYNHGSIALTSKGETDGFIAKYSADGNAINAVSFGGERFEWPEKITVDLEGNIIVAGIFYSYEFDVGPIHISKQEFQNDLFIIKFDPDLNPICLNRTSGDGENMATSLEIDAANNILLVVSEILGYTTHFGNKYILEGSGHPAMFVTIGNAQNFEPDPNGPFEFSVELGDDITTCDPVELDAGDFCNATYYWSTGEETSKITVTEPGTYWVEVTLNGTEVTDRIKIIGGFSDINLGDDLMICPGENISLDGTVSCNASYRWSTGSTSNIISVTSPGMYWVEATKGDHTERDTIFIAWKGVPVVDLGNDLLFCDGDAVSLSAQQELSVQYLWSTGETQPTTLVTAPGKYWVRVTGECTTVADTIRITRPDKIVFTLGDDRKVCAGEGLTLGPDIDGDFEFSWSNGSLQREIIVSESGEYRLTVSSQCETVTDEVVIQLITPEALNIPNVVTANPEHDDENNTFILPEDLRGSRVSVFNRWGNLIFSSENYQNTWPEVSTASGVYYYQLHGICDADVLKGSIHLIH